MAKVLDNAGDPKQPVIKTPKRERKLVCPECGKEPNSPIDVPKGATPPDCEYCETPTPLEWMLVPEPGAAPVVAAGAGGSIQLADLERIVDKLIATRGGAPGDGKMLELAVASMKQLGEEVGRTVRRSNASHPGVSVFNPKGEREFPKDRLRYETWFCGARQREDQLTPKEIELFNQFEGSKEARDGTWTAHIERNGSTKKLIVMVPAKTIDHLSVLPPLTQILSELLYGSDVVDPMQQLDRIKELEKKLAELQAQLAHPAVTA